MLNMITLLTNKENETMTKKEYNTYKNLVADFFKEEGISNLSAIQEEEGETESYFSHIPCDCCSRILGGDRYDCNGYNPKTKEIQEYSICPDCLYYAEYGQLDDMTMLDMEDK